MSNAKINILGGVLAGGQSRRMGGADKSLLKLGGKSLIELVCERMNSQCDSLIINANGDAARYAHLKLPVVPDIITGYAGPLAGIHAMMNWATQNQPQATHIASCAADTPYFPTDFVANCKDGLIVQNAKIALATSGGNRHPVFGLWAVELLEELDHFLKKGETGKVLAFVHEHAFCMVDFPITKDYDPFFNINHPQDLVNATQITKQ